MENKEIRINVRIGTMDLLSFMLYHTYTTLSGLFGLGLSLLSLAMLIGGFAAGDTVKTIILLVLGLLFTVVNPIMLFVKAKQQAMNNPVYKEILFYTLTDKGIALTVKNSKEAIEWNQVLKCKKTRRVLMLYTTEVHAILLPFACMEEKRAQIEAFIDAKVRGK